jgi:hypothetical protein
MKVIDIYNKIANGEEPPNKIRTLGYTFIYTGDKRPQKFYKLENQDNYLLRDFVYTLNTEVKIIEEEKIPEKLGHCEENTFMFKCKENSYLTREEMILLDSNFKELGNKINSIIDYLKSKGE